MGILELKPGFYFTGALDHDLRVFDIIMQKAYTKNAEIKGKNVVTDYYLEKGDYVKLDMLSLGVWQAAVFLFFHWSPPLPGSCRSAGSHARSTARGCRRACS